jgi:hypothetical protein
MSRMPAAAAALLLASTLSACTPSDDSTTSPTPSPSPPPSSGTPTPSESTTTSPSATPTGGEVTPTQDILDWQSVPGSVDDTVTRSTRTTVTVNAGNKTARIAGPQSLELGAGKRSTISTVLVDEQRVVVVVEDTLAERGDEATILDTSGGTAMLTGSSSPPTATGGTWAMGQETIVHATVNPDGGYCVATVSLESGQGSEGWCAAPNHGFRGAVITPAGLSVMSFDDTRPVSCATLLAIEGDAPTPIDGVTECSGWDAALLEGGAIWSEVPQPNRSEKAVFHASVDGTAYDLGPGTTGSLVWCGSAAYFVRDPQTKTDPARLLRFTTDGTLAVVYESASTGNAFLSAPRCGGDAITLTSYGEQGDEQVTADLS